MYAEERRAKISAILDEKGTVNSSDLARALDTSRETIRRDIQELAQRGLLIKTHGGAIATGNGDILFETPFPLREVRNAEEKKSICAFAATLLHEADTIFIDNSSTCAHLIRYIPKSLHITILTNSIKVIFDTMKYNAGNWIVLCTGGMLTDKTMSLSNYIAVNTLSAFSPTKSFMSCHGINPLLSVMDHHLDDVEIKRQVLKTAKRNYLLADYSKINNSGVAEIAYIRAFQHFITDEATPVSVLDGIRKEGLYVDTVSGKGKST